MFNLSLFLLHLVFILISVAFFTFFEQKILGYIHLRKGPSKTAVLGIFQPFADAIKLFKKEQMFFFNSNFMLFFLWPSLALAVSLGGWVMIPMAVKLIDLKLSLVLLMCIFSVGVFSPLLSGWASNSKYSLMGAFRAITQVISYEVSFSILTVAIVLIMESYSANHLSLVQKFSWNIFLMTPLALSWLASGLAETSRTPFDFSEGESELVSGFNTEYSSSNFALFFMAEYSSLIFISYLFAVLFLGGLYSSAIFILKFLFIGYLVVLLRGVLPRLRYDLLMQLAWKKFLPLSLSVVLYLVGCLSYFQLNL